MTDYSEGARGVIKKFSAWASSDQNRINVVFASYGSKSQKTTYAIRLVGYKYFVHMKQITLILL